MNSGPGAAGGVHKQAISVDEFVGKSSFKRLCSQEAMIQYIESGTFRDILDDIDSIVASFDAALDKEDRHQLLLPCITMPQVHKITVGLWKRCRAASAVVDAETLCSTDAMVAPIVCFATLVEIVTARLFPDNVNFAFLIMFLSVMEAAVADGKCDITTERSIDPTLWDELPEQGASFAIPFIACALHRVANDLVQGLSPGDATYLEYLKYPLNGGVRILLTCNSLFSRLESVHLVKDRALCECSLVLATDLMTIYGKLTLDMNNEYDVALRSQIYQELFPRVLEILPRFSQDGRDIYSGLEKYAEWGESFYARTFLYCLASYGFAKVFKDVSSLLETPTAQDDLTAIMISRNSINGMAACMDIVHDWTEGNFFVDEPLDRAADQFNANDTILEELLSLATTMLMALTQMQQSDRLHAKHVIGTSLTRYLLTFGVKECFDTMKHSIANGKLNIQLMKPNSQTSIFTSSALIVTLAVPFLANLCKGPDGDQLLEELMDHGALEMLHEGVLVLTCYQIPQAIERTTGGWQHMRWLPTVFMQTVSLLGQMCTYSEEISNELMSLAPTLLNFVAACVDATPEERHNSIVGDLMSAALNFLGVVVHAGYGYGDRFEDRIRARVLELLEAMNNESITINTLFDWIKYGSNIPQAEWRPNLNMLKMHEGTRFLLALRLGEAVQAEPHQLTEKTCQTVLGLLSIDLQLAESAQGALREMSNDCVLQILSPMALVADIATAFIWVEYPRIPPKAAQFAFSYMQLAFRVCHTWIMKELRAVMEESCPASSEDAKKMSRLVLASLQGTLEVLKEANKFGGKPTELILQRATDPESIITPGLYGPMSVAPLPAAHQELYRYLLGLNDVFREARVKFEKDKEEAAVARAKAQAAADAAMAALLAEEENSQQAQQDDNEKKKAKRQRQKEKQRALKEAAEAEERAKQEAEVAKAEAARRAAAENEPQAVKVAEAADVAPLRAPLEKENSPEDLNEKKTPSSMKKKKKKKKKVTIEVDSPDIDIEIAAAGPSQIGDATLLEHLNISTERLDAEFDLPEDPFDVSPDDFIIHAVPAATPAALPAHLDDENEDLKELLGHLLPGLDVIEQYTAPEQLSPAGEVGPISVPAEQLVPMLDVGEISGPIGDCLKDRRRWEELQMVLQCPVSGIAFQDPVILMDGCSYERNVVGQFGEAVAASVRPNHALRALMQELREQGCAL